MNTRKLNRLDRKIVSLGNAIQGAQFNYADHNVYDADIAHQLRQRLQSALDEKEALLKAPAESYSLNFWLKAVIASTAIIVVVIVAAALVTPQFFT